MRYEEPRSVTGARKNLDLSGLLKIYDYDVEDHALEARHCSIMIYDVEDHDALEARLCSIVCFVNMYWINKCSALVMFTGKQQTTSQSPPSRRVVSLI